MYNIKKAVRRLDFAPKIEGINIVDIKRGLGVFTPRPDKGVSLSALKNALKKAGYTLDSAQITVAGTLLRDEAGWWIDAETSGQRFALDGPDLERVLGGAAPGSRVEISGDWETVSVGIAAREVIRPKTSEKVSGPPKSGMASSGELEDVESSINGPGRGPGKFFAPIRTTSPGLTVYKGGAITPRYYFTKKHLGDLEVDNHELRVDLSYTPTPRLQLEAEVSLSRTSFEDESAAGQFAGSGSGFGNVILWGKYRFYRALETWGDRQAAARFGVELPTGEGEPPSAGELARSAFIRNQLTPIAGGLSVHGDVTYSQAKGRFILGGNLQCVVRSERDGFRLGHEIRLNTDLEYVLLPLKYRSPTNELFLILESTYVSRGRGRAEGIEVPGSSSSEFYIAPALQYVASPRFLIEASLQLPVVMNAGPQVLRADHNLLVGIRYLY